MRNFAKKRAFTLIEILIVSGIVTGLIAFLLPRAARLRLNQRDAKIIAELQEINLQIQTYKNRKGVYPPNPDSSSGVCLGIDGGTCLISTLKNEQLLPSNYTPKFPIFYQEGYQFSKFTENCAQTLGNTKGKNPSWTGQESKLSGSPISDLTKNTCISQNSASYLERQRQFYGIDLDANGHCSEQAEVGEGGLVGYRLGAALYASEVEAIRDATPCTDRFFDIVGY